MKKIVGDFIVWEGFRKDTRVCKGNLQMLFKIK